MAIDNSILNAQILSAQLQADLGAVDIPQSIIYDLLGFTVFPGQQVFDSVAGGIVEVVDAGVESVNANEAGS